MKMTQDYEWVGDGVLARLTVGFSDDIRGITYAMSLRFDDFTLKSQRDQANIDRILADGDKNGWDSTVNNKKDIAILKSRIKNLEENARQRGDRVISR